MNKFANQVRTRRKEAGLTQRELALRAGLSTSYVSAIERVQPHPITGAPLDPSREVVDALARALGWDEDEARTAAGYAPSYSAPANNPELAVIDFLYPGLSGEDRHKIDLLIELLEEAVKKALGGRDATGNTDDPTPPARLE